MSSGRKGSRLDPPDSGPRSHAVPRPQENGVGHGTPRGVSFTPTRKENTRPKDTGTPGSSNFSRAKDTGTPGSSNLSKPLSKSHDNLASTLRKKAVAAALADSNSKDMTSSPVPSGGKFKVPKSLAGASGNTPIRKAQSQQNIDKVGDPIKRTQSAQNISSPNKAPGGPAEGQGKKTPTNNLPKRAVSSQNIAKKHRHARSSNSSNVAYNAELLASFEKEKKQWELRTSELTFLAENRKTENERYKFEVRNLKAQIPPQSVFDELEILRSENKTLKEKLHELGVTLEHSTDNDKLCMLQKEQEKNASAIPPLDADASVDCDLGGGRSGHGGSVGDLSWVTPEHPSSISLDNNWDNRSNKSDALSEVSVACLQDRILQMEETHYSTSEELQATLQELGDLQDSVNQLSDENELLADERSVLLDSLCAQTEKLENCRMQIDQLKALLVNDSERGDRSENEKQLVALVKSSQEEKEELQLRQMELSNMVGNLEALDREQSDVIQALKDKSHILELKNESVKSDKRALESHTTELRETSATDQIEIQRYKTLLDNERQKVVELEQFRNAVDKSDLEELLDNTRQEKDRLDDRLTNIQEELAVCQNTVCRLEELNSSLEEQVKVLTNNAKTDVSDLEYKLEKKEKEKVELQEEIGSLRDHIDQLQLDCDRYLEEKKTYSATVNKLEADLKAVRHKSTEHEQEAKELRHKYVEDQEEWRQFQADLQTAVVIANDIKMETQEDMEKLLADNQYLKDMKANLEAEIETTREDLEKIKQEKDQVSGIRGKVISSLDRELTNLRTTRKPSDLKGGSNPGLSVKNIIHTIEEQVKGVGSPMSPVSPSPLSPTTSGSRRESSDSNFSFKSDTITLGSPRTPVGDRERRSSVGDSGRRSTSLSSSLSGGESTSALKGLLRSKGEDGRSPISHRHTISGMSNIIYESAPPSTSDDGSPGGSGAKDAAENGKKHSLTSILKEPSSKIRRGSGGPEKEQTPEKVIFPSSAHTAQGLKSDPLAGLAKEMGGSKRNALLTWCKLKTVSYTGIDITNFSSSWNDGLAFCAIMHNYLPQRIPFKELNTTDKHRNFTLAFKAAEDVGISSNLSVSDMVAMERPDWQAVMNYVTSIYKHFEVDNKT